MADDIEIEMKLLEGLDAIERKHDELAKRLGELDTQTAPLSQAVEQVAQELQAVKAVTRQQAETLQQVEKALSEYEEKLSARRERAVRRAGKAARQLFREMLIYAVNPRAEVSDAAKRAFTGAAGLGAATVPSEVAAEVYDTIGEYGQFNTLTVMPVGARSVTLPMMSALPSGTWIGPNTGGTSEGSTISATDFSGLGTTLTVQTFACLVQVSDELLQDAEVDITSFVTEQLGRRMAYGLDWIAFAADGTSDTTDAGYTGIFWAHTINSNLAATAGAGKTSVASLTLDDFITCVTTAADAVRQRGARWWMAPAVLAKIALIRDTTGRPIFQSAVDVPLASVGTILGYPVTPVAVAPASDQAGQPVAVFGDPRGAVVGLRQAIDIAYSPHAYFTANAHAFRATVRAGSAILTTAGSTTLKPFGVLVLAST